MTEFQGFFLISLLILCQKSWALQVPPTPISQPPLEGIHLGHADPSHPGAAPLSTFAERFEDAIEKKDITSIVEMVDNTADSFLISIEKAPSDFLKHSIAINLRTLDDSKLPNDLRDQAKKYLQKISDDHFLHFEYDVGNATQGLLHYKNRLNEGNRKENFNEALILKQAPELLMGIDRILSTLSDHLQDIVGNAVGLFYTITMDTITNHYENWQKMPNSDIVWMDPQYLQNGVNRPSMASYQPNGPAPYPVMPPMTAMPSMLAVPQMPAIIPASSYVPGVPGVPVIPYLGYAPASSPFPNLPKTPLFPELPANATATPAKA